MIPTGATLDRVKSLFAVLNTFVVIRPRDKDSTETALSAARATADLFNTATSVVTDCPRWCQPLQQLASGRLRLSGQSPCAAPASAVRRARGLPCSTPSLQVRG